MKKVILELDKKHVMDLRHKLIRKENPIYVKLREAIEKQSKFCLHCGKKL